MTGKGVPPPSMAAVLSLAVVAYGVFAAEVTWHCGFFACAAECLDNPAYVELARIVRTGHVTGAIPHHFWGFPAAIASLAALLRISELSALVTISIGASLLTTALVWRLYGPWIAGFAVLINPIWLWASVTGGSEPLFSCLIYAALLAWRRDRSRVAAAAAMVSATVRPVGALAVLCFGVLLANDRRWRELLALAVITLVISGAYAGMAWRITGNPFISIAGYQVDWVAPDVPLTWPFHVFIPAYLHDLVARRWTVALLETVWVVLPVVALAVTWTSERGRILCASHSTEILLLSTYILFFWCYNQAEVPEHFGRFLLPVLPLILLALRDWLPRRWSLLWIAAIASSLVSAAQMVGFAQVFGFGLP